MNFDIANIFHELNEGYKSDSEVCDSVTNHVDIQYTEPNIQIEEPLQHLDEQEHEQEASDDEGTACDDPLCNKPTLEIPQYYVSKDGNIMWRKQSTTTFKRRCQGIMPYETGPQGDAKNTSSPAECWSLLITPDMINNLVNYTNIYIEKNQEKCENRPNVKRNTTVNEIKALIGLLYLAGIYHANRLNLEDLWQERTGVEIFRSSMTLNRFRFLLSCLQFDDINTREERQKLDKFTAIRDLFDQFVCNCNTNYKLSEYATIDKMYIPFRASCPFSRYIPSKSTKRGLKMFALADSKTGYVSKLEVFVNNQPEGPYNKSNAASDIVERMTSPIHGSGRNITMGKWFTSYQLAVDLYLHYKLTIVGEVPTNMAQIPLSFLRKKTRDLHSTMFGFQELTTLISYIPTKGENVVLLSSMHHTAEWTHKINSDKQEPEIITFYNTTKGIVDSVARLCSLYDTTRNSRKWTAAIFFTMLNIAGVNSYIINSFISGTKIKRRNFLKNLALQLVTDHEKDRANSKSLQKDMKLKLKHWTNLGLDSARLQGHSESSKPGARSHRCQDCPRKKDRKTRHHCKICFKFICTEHSVYICRSCLTLSNDSSQEEDED